MEPLLFFEEKSLKTEKKIFVRNEEMLEFLSLRELANTIRAISRCLLNRISLLISSLEEVMPRRIIS